MKEKENKDKKEEFLNTDRDQVTIESNLEYLMYLNLLELQKLSKNIQRNTEILEKHLNRRKK